MRLINIYRISVGVQCYWNPKLFPNGVGAQGHRQVRDGVARNDVHVQTRYRKAIEGMFPLDVDSSFLFSTVELITISYMYVFEILSKALDGYVLNDYGYIYRISSFYLTMCLIFYRVMEDSPIYGRKTESSKCKILWIQIP